MQEGEVSKSSKNKSLVKINSQSTKVVGYCHTDADTKQKDATDYGEGFKDHTKHLQEKQAKVFPQNKNIIIPIKNTNARNFEKICPNNLSEEFNTKF